MKLLAKSIGREDMRWRTDLFPSQIEFFFSAANKLQYFEVEMRFTLWIFAYASHHVPVCVPVCCARHLFFLKSSAKFQSSFFFLASFFFGGSYLQNFSSAEFRQLWSFNPECCPSLCGIILLWFATTVLHLYTYVCTHFLCLAREQIKSSRSVLMERRSKDDQDATHARYHNLLYRYSDLIACLLETPRLPYEC